MVTKEFRNFTDLIKQRNEVEVAGSKIIGRPFIIGHIGEYIASEIFDIKLNESASAKGHDGYFNNGPLKGCSVNIKYYSRKGRLLDLCKVEGPDFYLVLMGSSDKKEIAPWDIESVYLFDTKWLLEKLEGKVKIGVASSVRKEYWNSTMIYPVNVNKRIILSKDEIEKLELLNPHFGL